MTTWILLLTCLPGAFNQVAGQPTQPLRPEQLVQQQIDAWNRRDADAFAAPYSDATRLSVFPDRLLQRFGTRAELRQYYADFFAQNPNVHGNVVGQLVVGNTVVLAEHITGRADGRTVHSIVTYKIEGDRIARVYFDFRP